MKLSLLNKTAAHDEGVWSASWIPGSKHLLTGSVDENVKLWEETESALQFRHTYTGHTLGVISVIVDATGTFAASSALDSFIRVWNLQDHSTHAVLEQPPTETWGIAFGKCEGSVAELAAAGGSRGVISLWRLSTTALSEVAQLPLPQSGGKDRAKRDPFVLSVAYNDDFTKVACGAMDGTVAVFDVASQKLISRLDGHYKPVRSLAFVPGSQMLVTASDDTHANLYDTQHGALVDSFSGHESWVLSVACHPDGKSFATGSSDSKVKLWDLQTRSHVQTASEHTDQVWSVAFNQDGSRLASTSDDKSVAVYSCG